ncbi:MAG: EamA family transporter [Clostridia bacterium]|nr:EamA family transporter [Clostridia bacterium]
MNKNESKGFAYFTLVLTFVLWGSNYVVNKFASAAVPGQVLAGLRTFVSIVPLYFIARRSMPFPKIEKGDFKYFFLVGFLGYFVMHNVNIIGIKLTNASTSGTINGLTPVAIALIAAVVLKEKLDWVKLLCLGLAIAGTLVVSSGSVAGNPLGIAALVVALICWGAASVFMRKLGKKYPSIMVTFYAVLIASAFHIPVVGATAFAQGGLDIFNKSTILCILYLGIVVTGIGHMLWARALSKLEATFCSCFYPLQALSATVLGVIFLGEKVGVSFFVGLALIAADVVIMCLHNRKLEQSK